MKSPYRVIFITVPLFTILYGCATNEEIKETDADALLNQGAALLEEGKYDLSINYFNKALKTNPNLADAYNNRGIAYYNKGQYDKAISDFTKAIGINPTFAEAYKTGGLPM